MAKKNSRKKSPPKPASAKPKGVLGRTQWLDQALVIIEQEGIGGVRVERLARDLGVTKGSFYHHFDDLADLQKNILVFWADEFTSDIIRDVAGLISDPKERLKTLIKAVEEKELARFDLAIRGWAAHDAKAAAAIKKVYGNRLKFVRSIFSELGFTGDELEMRTRTVVIYYSWQQTINNGMPRDKRRKLRDLHLELLCETGDE